MICSYLFGVCSGAIIMVVIIAISDEIEAYQFKREIERRKQNAKKKKKH